MAERRKRDRSIKNVWALHNLYNGRENDEVIMLAGKELNKLKS
jgi:hypothetical protein